MADQKPDLEVECHPERLCPSVTPSEAEVPLAQVVRGRAPHIPRGRFPADQTLGSSTEEDSSPRCDGWVAPGELRAVTVRKTQDGYVSSEEGLDPEAKVVSREREDEWRSIGKESRSPRKQGIAMVIRASISFRISVKGFPGGQWLESHLQLQGTRL